ncbi:MULTISPECIES: UDP-N-acetylmuramoyl-L-alanyl-D-glutamate--2,6-diaminopimelate ligase [unclassified Helicobacter]|uniref:UDP-N-acetylmuramoyl-L-alanyl-D-glutamate--2, 6-diaminopimelate ligase n=1 Tax=unclassified Helicobacter TaxID=2593540 RepID=UPI000CF04084|nr:MULTISPECIES: UDP-N-acetylmuramoyl-L-alanyl-D-glutamate--2,6-diaminopimelate ligase [unclassified Helicobacter]
MKIDFMINYEGREYQYLSDNTRDDAENVLFVETPRNKEFAEAFKRSNRAVLNYKELKKYFSFPSKIIGITGTNGKTTIANLIYHILLDNGYSCAMIGTQGVYFNHRQVKAKGLTTPTILELYQNFDFLAKNQCEVVVMEVSSHAIEQERIYGIDFDVRVLSNITSDHLDYHKDLRTYRDVKNSFFGNQGKKVINLDEKNAKFNPSNTLLYSIFSQADIWVKRYDLADGISAQIVCGDREIELKSRLYGLHNLYNILAAVGSIWTLNLLPLKKAIQSLENFKGVSGRMEVISNQPLIIVDFAHTHDGMERIFQSFPNRNIVVLFGAGGDRDRSKRPLMGKIADQYAKRIYLTNDNPRTEDPLLILQDILDGISQKQKVVVELDRREAIKKAMDSQEQDEILFILGKGDEVEQILKDKTIPFDDREVVREFL